jgi:hypothetical protein
MTDQPHRPRKVWKRGASRKGRPNGDVFRIRSMIGEALHRAGGVNYLVKQAHENPGPFMQLVAKCMPRDVIATAEVGPNLAAALNAAMHRRLSMTQNSLPINGLRDATDGQIIVGAGLPALPPEAAGSVAQKQQVPLGGVGEPAGAGGEPAGAGGEPAGAGGESPESAAPGAQTSQG